MSSQQNPHTQAEPRRFGRTRLGSVQGLVWFASLMVLLLLIVVAVFDMRVAGIMRPATTDAASAPAPASPPAAAASDPDATASAAAPASAKASAPASASAPVSATAQAATAAQADTGRSASGASQTGFRPPAADDIADTPMGEVIRTGERIFLHTGVNAKAFVGNALNCVYCHLDAGRLADSAPMWGAYLLYPAYRNKTKHVDTFAERLRGCFTYSMNGKAPPMEFREGVELKLLREFTPTHDWVLNPGDMLYLPPKVPHHGVAVNPCLTISVGMRAPSSADRSPATVR